MIGKTSVNGLAVRMDRLKLNLTGALEHINDQEGEIEAVRNDITNLEHRINMFQGITITVCLRENQQLRKQDIIVHTRPS